MNLRNAENIFIMIIFVMISSPIASLAQIKENNVFSQQAQKQYEYIRIRGDVWAYDPSVEYGDDNTGWLAYSSAPEIKAGLVETYLAKTNDEGKTWTKVNKIDEARDVVLQEKGVFYKTLKETPARLRHETPTLLYDPYDPDPGKRWKLFWIAAYLKLPSEIGGYNKNTIWQYTQVFYKHARSPDKLAGAEEIRLFGTKWLNNCRSEICRVKYNLNQLHPDLADTTFYMEPGSLAKDGVIYLTFTAASVKRLQRTILISSKDHGQTWHYVGELTNKDTLEKDVDKNYTPEQLLLTSSALAEENNKQFLLVSPRNRGGQGKYNGVYIFEFDDITRGKLKRNQEGKLIVHKYLPAISSEWVGGGQSEYHEKNTYGGIIMSQTDNSKLGQKEFFKVYNTKKKIVVEEKLTTTNGSRVPITFGIEYANPIWTGLLDYPRLAKAFADIDVKAVKIQDVLWQQIEPKEPKDGIHNYRWDELDNLVKIFQAEGFNSIEIVLQSTSPWGTRKPTFSEKLRSSPFQKTFPSLPPKEEHWQDYYDFVYNTVERYDMDGIDDMAGLKYPVREFEIETEAQGTYFWLGTADEYIRLLQTAHRAAKAANPESEIILSGIGLGDVPMPGVDIEDRVNLIDFEPKNIAKEFRKLWLSYADFNQQILGQKDFFDTAEFHSLENYSAIHSTVGWIREIMRSHGYEKPIEIGDAVATPTLVLGPITPYPHPFYPLGHKDILKILLDKNNPRYDEIHSWYRAEQSRQVVKKIAAAMELGLKKINFQFFTDLSFLGVEPKPEKNTLGANWSIAGFLDSNYNPYPAYFTYKLAIEKLKNAEFVKRLSLGNDVYGFEFLANGKTLYVLWSDRKKNVTLNVNLSSRFAEITDIPIQFRQQVPVTKEREVKNRVIALELTETPIFVENR